MLRPFLPKVAALVAAWASAAPLAAQTTGAEDRFTAVLRAAPADEVRDGFIINGRRVALQKELAKRPPGPQDIGVRLPPGATPQLETTARQIMQYDPTWRVYEYRMPLMGRDAFIAYFREQGLVYNPRKETMVFVAPAGNDEDFIDGIRADGVASFRIWRRPRAP